MGRRGRLSLRILALVATAAIAVVAWVHIASERALLRRYAVAPPRLVLQLDGAEIDRERGRHLTTVVAQCPFCHGTDLGGKEMADDPWIGRLDAPNLTRGRGGVASAYSQADWIRAVRYGIHPSGRSLLLMPSAHLSQMADSDLASLMAYLESVPSVDRSTRPLHVGALTRLALATGRADELLSARSVDPRQVGPASIEAAASRDYGRYLVDLGSCRICHHADLRGGLHPLSLPGEPPPPDLRPGGALTGWSRADFDRAMRHGETPDGRLLDRTYMPWPSFAGLGAEEIDALWLYLQQPEDVAPDEATAQAVTRTAGRLGNGFQAP